jgi:hypothetical protein
MEDDHKIIKVEYLSNHWSDLPQILNLSSGDKTKKIECLKWKRPPMEDDLKILKAEYLNNHWSDLPQILDLLRGPNQNKKCLNHNMKYIYRSITAY